MRRKLILALMLSVGAMTATAAGDNSMDVIVRFKPSANNTGHARFVERGATYKKSLELIGARVYHIKSADYAALAAQPEIDYIGPDHAVQATQSGIMATPDYGWMTVLGVTSPSATLPYDGTGVGVAVIDSGIVNAPDLQGPKGNRVVYQQSMIPSNGDVNDHYGHGTMVAGLIGGDGKNSTGTAFDYTVRGIAPNVNLINLRVLDNNGSATDSTVIAGIQQAIAFKSKYNIRVINLSLGRPVFESYTVDPLCQAVQQAWNAGIVVVVAAGNDGRDNSFGNEGYGTVNAPANSPYVITVGAMNTLGTLTEIDDKIASYSAKGPTLIDHVAKPDLVAPGNRVVSILAPGSYLISAYRVTTWSKPSTRSKTTPRHQPNTLSSAVHRWRPRW